MKLLALIPLLALAAAAPAGDGGERADLEQRVKNPPGHGRWWAKALRDNVPCTVGPGTREWPRVRYDEGEKVILRCRTSLANSPYYGTSDGCYVYGADIQMMSLPGIIVPECHRGRD